MLIKAGIPILVIAVIFLGGWYLQKNQPSTETANERAGGTKMEKTTGSQAAMISSRDASNESLEQDLSAFDAELSGLDSESSLVDQSLHDKPIEQAQ